MRCQGRLSGDSVSNMTGPNEAGTPLNGDAFRLRMERQCSEIRAYRKSVLRDSGRRLSLDEAALEWIERFAENFDVTNGRCW